MERQELLALFDREQRVDIFIPGVTREVLPNIVRFTRPKPGMNFVLYSDLDESNADGVIAEQVTYFQQRELPFEWKVFGHDVPQNLTERLEEYGLQIEEPDSIMVLDVHDAPQHLLQPVTADIRRLTKPAQLADVVAVLEPVWMRNFDWVYERMGREMAEPGYLSMYVAYVEDRPVSVGWTHFHEGHFASLWGGSTLEFMRGRGLYTALLATRVQEAIARGKRFVTLDAGPMSRPIVARYGFFELTTAVACEWRPEAQR